VKENHPPLVRPFLKWPGGKYRLVTTLKSYLGQGSCLVEPFVGAGALFLNTQHREVIVNDINPDLINLFRQLQNNSLSLTKDAKKLFNAKNNQAKVYYRIRERFNNSQDLWERALLFLFLNRHGYNGLCRYNAKGFYNVPFGAYKRPYFPENEMLFFSKRAQHVTFHCQDYKDLLNGLLQSPILHQMTIYCDPPYAPLTETANFTGYAAKRFTLDDQKHLAGIAKALAKKGAKVVISNHDTPFTREIYRTAKCQKIEVSRTISCNTSTRNKVSEIIACFSVGSRSSKRSKV
jgi:DNA adenine methylase